MNCKQRLIIECLSCLISLGLRAWLIRLLAYHPPERPTYTLRGQDHPLNYENYKKFRQTSYQQASSQGLSSMTLHPQIRGGSETILKNSDSNRSHMDSRNAKSLYEDSLRFHRISSAIVEKDSRPYKVQLDERQDSQKSQMDSENKYVLRNKSIDMVNEIKENRQTFLLRCTNQQKTLKLVNRITLMLVDVALPDDLHMSAYFVRTRLNQSIPCLLIQSTMCMSDYIMIHSHGNSADLGIMLDTYLDLAYNLNINVIGYDYTGYGQSTGKPSDVDCISDLEGIYEFVVQALGFKWQNILLYGQSIGSGPSVTLASNPLYPVGGMVIHSGFTSGFRILAPDIENTHKYDLFPNLDYIKKVNCLVYIIHGLCDDQIPSTHAEKLSNNVNNLHKVWYVEQAGHNNIEKQQEFRKDYFFNLRDFLKEVTQKNNFYKPKHLLKFYQADDWTNSSFEHLYRQNMLTQGDLDTQVNYINSYESQTFFTISSNENRKPLFTSMVSNLDNRGSIQEEFNPMQSSATLRSRSSSPSK